MITFVILHNGVDRNWQGSDGYVSMQCIVSLAL